MIIDVEHRDSDDGWQALDRIRYMRRVASVMMIGVTPDEFGDPYLDDEESRRLAEPISRVELLTCARALTRNRSRPWPRVLQGAPTTDHRDAPVVEDVDAWRRGFPDRSADVVVSRQLYPSDA